MVDFCGELLREERGLLSRALDFEGGMVMETEFDCCEPLGSIITEARGTNLSFGLVSELLLGEFSLPRADLESGLSREGDCAEPALRVRVLSPSVPTRALAAVSSTLRGLVMVLVAVVLVLVDDSRKSILSVTLCALSATD